MALTEPMRPTSPKHANMNSAPSFFPIPHQLTHAWRQRQIQQASAAGQILSRTFHQQNRLAPACATITKCTAAVLPVYLRKPAGLHRQRVRSQAEPLNNAQLWRQQIQLSEPAFEGIPEPSQGAKTLLCMSSIHAA